MSESAKLPQAASTRDRLARQAEIAIVLVLAALIAFSASVVIGRKLQHRGVVRPGWIEADAVRSL